MVEKLVVGVGVQNHGKTIDLGSGIMFFTCMFKTCCSYLKDIWIAATHCCFHWIASSIAE